VSSVVLDASAVLAVIFAETGAEVVIPRLPGALLSAVNLAEVVGKSLESGLPLETARREIERLPLQVIPLAEEQAYLAASLRPATLAAGLSLADRACLALARMRQAVALTADRQWKAIEIGVEVVLIR
jgi:PIN domain nuclease of toxin-antitoxin system